MGKLQIVVAALAMAGAAQAVPTIDAKSVTFEQKGAQRAAESDAERRNETSRLQDEIDRVAQTGGGRVTVTNGVHPCGTLYLKSNVELHLEEGAELRGGGRPADYDDAIPVGEVYSYEGAVPTPVRSFDGCRIFVGGKRRIPSPGVRIERLFISGL